MNGKNILFDVDIVLKKKSKCGLLTTMCHHSFFFFLLYTFCMLSEFAKVFVRKVWHIQVAHLHNAAHALSSPCFQLSTNLDKNFFCYLWYCGKKQIECGLVWSVLLLTTSMHHHGGQNLLWTRLAMPLMSPQHFDHCTDHPKPHTIWKLYPCSHGG